MKAKKILFIVFALAICSPSSAQIFDKIKKTIGKATSVISLDKLSRDPVTTSFKDVNKTKYLEDDFGNDAVYKNIHDQPYTWEKGFFLTPGFYQGNFNSFCIKAGTYAPQSGNGRFYAELKGPKADIISAIIEGYQKDPDITQKEVQLLLWAIIAKTDFQKMKGPIKVTALKLLTPNQLARLSKGALETYATNEIKDIAKKNETLRYIMEAENNLRRKYYQGVSEYSEYEEVAMRAGVEPIFHGFNKGRWTKHPNGFFIRYSLKSYRGTLTQIYVPENNIEAYTPIRGKGPYTSDFYPTTVGTYYQSRNSIATPANPAGQRIIQTDVPPGGTVWGGGSSGDPSGSGGTSGGSNDTGNETGNDGSTGGNSSSGGTDETNGSGGNDGTSGSGGNGGNDGTGGNSSGGTLPSNEEEKNPFDCEEVIHPIADATIKQEMLFQNIPGAIVCVFKGDSIIHMKAYGKMGPGKPLTLESRLHWASISKSVTAVAAMQMVEIGSRLKLSDKPSKLLPYWPSSIEVEDEDGNTLTDNRLGEITLQHLLNNSSGIQHYGKGMNDSTATIYKRKKVPFVRNTSYEDLLNGQFNAQGATEMFNKSVLDFKPGTDYLYSSYGFVLAGAMIDKQSNNGYEAYIMKHIKDRLGLESFQKTTNEDKYGYEMFNDGIVGNHPVGSFNKVLPAGGWESTICDLATYARALSRGELLYEDNALWKKENMYMFDDMTTRGYGLGVNRMGTGDNLRVYHGGTNNYARSYMQFFPSDTTGIVVLSSLRHADLERLIRNLVNNMNLRVGLYGSDTRPLNKCHHSMKSKNDQFVGVWRRTGKDQIIRTGLDLESFKIEMNTLKSYGYYLDSFDISYTGENNKEIYDGVFKKGNKTQVLITGKYPAGIDREVIRFREQGLEIVDVNYGRDKPENVDDGVYNFTINALFERDAPQSTLFHSFTTLDIADKINEKQGQNLRLIDIEAIPVYKDSHQNFLCLFTAGSPNKFLIENQTDFRENLKNGTYSSFGQILDIESYYNNNREGKYWSVASIWETSGVSQKTSINETDDYTMSFCNFMDLHTTNEFNGYELIDWERTYTEPTED